MRSSLSPLLFAVVLLWSAVPAHAVTVDDLYTATVPVADKGGEAQRRGFRAGLEQVLVRVAGNAGVLEQPEVAPMLESPARLVQQFRYERIERDADGTGEGSGGADVRAAQGDESDSVETAPTHRLRVTFSGARIEQQLRDAGVVVWGEQRPEVLVWLAVDDRRGRRIVAADSSDPAHRALIDEGRRRALPLLMPLMDMSDRSRIEYLDISGAFFDALRTASERYRADILLVGHVRRDGGGWRADWNLLGLGERLAWSGSPEALEAAVALGIDGATDRLAAAMAGRAGESTALRVRVRDVDSLAAYARVTQYLDQLVRVRSYSIERVRPDEIVFAVTVQGGIAEFERAIALGTALEQLSFDELAGEAAAEEDEAAGTPAGLARPDPDRRPERVFRFAG